MILFEDKISGELNDLSLIDGLKEKRGWKKRSASPAASAYTR
jgi:hypothetical protein